VAELFLARLASQRLFVYNISILGSACPLCLAAKLDGWRAIDLAGRGTVRGMFQEGLRGTSLTVVLKPCCYWGGAIVGCIRELVPFFFSLSGC